MYELVRQLRISYVGSPGSSGVLLLVSAEQQKRYNDSNVLYIVFVQFSNRDFI